MNINKEINLDELNNNRIKSARKNVADNIRLLSNPIECLIEDRVIDNCEKDISKCVCSLSSTKEEIQFACEHFNWDNMICSDIDNALGNLGYCLAELENDEKERDIKLAGSYGKDAINILGTVLASLIIWFDDEY